MNRPLLRPIPLLLLPLSLAGFLIFLFGPFGMESDGASPMDFLFLGLSAAHFVWWLFFIRRTPRSLYRLIFRVPEIFFALTLMLFLFSYIYASNANMDYVQRFAASSENLRLAPDSRVERLNSLLRYLPFLAYHLCTIVYYRISKRNFFIRYSGTASPFSIWGIFFALASAFCYTVSLPSFLRLDGIPVLGWVCMVPLLMVMMNSSRFWAAFYGVTFGVIQTMLCNYWLGTFSLISLQFITVYYLIIYTLFMTVLVHLLEQTRWWKVIIFPAAWVAFDFLRTVGFMGYPWAMLGVSQYNFLPFIQLASVTGVWGVSFFVYAANAVIAYVLVNRKRWTGRPVRLSLSVLLLAVAAVTLGGRIYLSLHPDGPAGGTVPSATVALIQQNTDPRKNDYEEGLEVLKKLTDQALPYNPDLVAWSETAFVPNIRRWSKLEPAENYYARLVHDFLAYQRKMETWLITGNDDYFITIDEEGAEIREDFNAAVFFSPEGTRMETYHKIHLVPFTEYFPFKKQLPWMYELLLNFDVNLWTPGNEPVVFEHPKFSFSTPICFEDSFPRDVRRFVRAGAEVIINLSNDFWSLTNVEAKQHFVNAKFRAVENRRHFLRATASGVTAHVTPAGRVVSSLPYYEEGYLITEIPAGGGQGSAESRGQGGPMSLGQGDEAGRRRSAVYTVLGDWFPYACMALLGIVLFYRVFTLFLKRER